MNIARAVILQESELAQGSETEGTAAPVRPRKTSAARLPATRALFESYVQAGRAPGVVAAFGVGDQPPQFISAGRGGYEPDSAPVGPDTLWRIYSMTKPITGMATMMLIEQGKIGLDQPLHEIFPEFQSMRVATEPDRSLDSRPAARPITIRHLLTHTAGLAYEFGLPAPLREAYLRLGLTPHAFDVASDAEARRARAPSLQAFAERVAEAPLLSDPGTEWRYSLGLDVLGAVIERVSGVAFEQFLATQLFAPLGMTSTSFAVAPGEVHRLVNNYRFVEGSPVLADAAASSLFLRAPSFPYGGGGLVSSARDYDRFLNMLQNGGELDGARVMQRDTVRLGMSNLLPAGVTFNGVGEAPTGPPMGFGAGGSVTFQDPSGGWLQGAYGWGGAAGTIASINPGVGVRMTLMVNYMPAAQWPLRDETVAALASDLAA